MPKLNTTFITPTTGFPFRLVDKDSESVQGFGDYDKTVASCHVNAIGCVILDDFYLTPLDNEFDIAEIYQLVWSGQCD